MQATVPPPPSDQVPAIVLHDARAVHDVASLQLLDFAGDGTAWAIVQLTPGPGSGSGTTPGGYIRADTGESVDPPNARLVLLKNGTWQLLAGSTDWGHNRGKYEWTQPVGEQKRRLDPDDYYSPFVRGGAILFHPGAAEEGDRQFQDVHLLFREWVDSVGPAAHELEPRSALFGEKVELEQVAELAQLSRDSNPLIAIRAFRQLVIANRMPPDVASAIFSGAEGHLAAVIAYLAIAHSDLGATLAESRSQSKLRELALGAFSLALLRPNETAILAKAKNTLRNVKRRLKEMHSSGDPYVASMFSTAGIGR